MSKKGNQAISISSPANVPKTISLVTGKYKFNQNVTSKVDSHLRCDMTDDGESCLPWLHLSLSSSLQTVLPLSASGTYNMHPILKC